MENIAIIGIGMIPIKANYKTHNFADMAWETVNAALADAGISIKDVDNVITTSNDFWDGRTISCMAVGDASGVREKNCSCVEGDGTFGAFYGMARILSGSYGTTLVTGHTKGSESISSLITNAAFDPIYERALGPDMISGCAMQARAYMEKHGLTSRQTALVSVKNHGNAKHNPYAQLPMDISVDDVLASEMIADPLRKLDCSPVSDGCCAIILANEEKAKKLCKKPVWVKGAAFTSDAYFLGDRDLADPRSLVAAAKKAYAMAGITDPTKQIDIAEVYDAFSYQELMWLEGLGICEPGQAASLLEKGDFAVNGKLPVNASGGLLSGHPVIAAGLYRIAECVRQLRGEAGAVQKDGAKTAVAQGLNGVAGQSHCVWVLGADK
ncbi:MAG: thiolase family protein [Desulfatibacillaceae bacterium]|nr:thiolase family protein [Desulfatibacillaceae bacterium]